MADGRLVLVALGGNAISLPDEEGTVEQQFEHSRETARHLIDLSDAGYRLVVTHGNGPQIGNTLLRNEAAAGKIYPIPMYVAVADVQGGMGFMIAQTLTNELQSCGRTRVATAIVTSVLLDADDPAFANPTKPVGRTLSAAEAEKFLRAEGWQVKETSPGKFRRVVPSPEPRAIIEIETIRRLVNAGELVVACGGGGIPVVRDAQGDLRGVRAVIDKDLASALLAAQVGAERMAILTNVERVMIDYEKPHQHAIEQMTLSEARDWLRQGRFPAGSMGPKIQGAISFLANAPSERAEVVIGPLEKAAEVVAGFGGTRIVKS